MLKRLAAVLLVGAVYFTTALAWPAPGFAQVVSSRQAVCDPQYPTRCIKPAVDGSIAVTGASGSSGATASAASLPVTVGTGKPQNIDLFSQTRVLVGDALGDPIDWTAPVPVTQSGTWSVAASATGGCSPGGYQTTASTNATSVKGSAGTLCSGVAINTTATLYYLRLYNLAAAPTCSSATGFVTTIPVPASATGAGTIIPLGTYGADFATGIAFCITGGGTSTDNTNAASGVYVTLTYK